MVFNLSQTDVLKDFCALILCGHHEKGKGPVLGL